MLLWLRYGVRVYGSVGGKGIFNNGEMIFIAGGERSVL